MLCKCINIVIDIVFKMNSNKGEKLMASFRHQNNLKEFNNHTTFQVLALIEVNYIHSINRRKHAPCHIVVDFQTTNKNNNNYVEK